MADSVILIEQVEGTDWTVAHDPVTRVVVVTPSLPEWASPEDAEVHEALIRAMVSGSCPRCGATASHAPAGGVVRQRLPHADDCPLNAAFGTLWVAEPLTEEAAEAVRAYVSELTGRLGGE